MAKQAFEQFVERLLSSLKERRRELGLTQGELGERLGRPQSAVARLESGKIKDPHLSMLFQFARALDLELTDISLVAKIHIHSEPENPDIPLSQLVRIMHQRAKMIEGKKYEAIADILNGLEKLL